MKKRLSNYFRAGFPGIAIQTSEEQRAIADVIDAAKEVKRSVATWSATEGLAFVLPAPKPIDDTQDLGAASAQRLENTVYILRDAQTWPYDRDFNLARSLRDLLAWAPTEGSCIVFIGPSFKSHPTFEKSVVVTDYTLPGTEGPRRYRAERAETQADSGP